MDTFTYPVIMFCWSEDPGLSGLEDTLPAYIWGTSYADAVERMSLAVTAPGGLWSGWEFLVVDCPTPSA